LFLICACAHQPDAVVSDAETLNVSGIRKLMVFPFRDMSQTAEKDTGVRCPFSGSMFITGIVASEAESVLTDGLISSLKGLKKFDVFPAGQAYTSSVSDVGRYNADKQYLIQIARKAGADSVMIGHIYRYQERAGNEYAVNSPASVSFDVHLIRVSDARVLWSDRWDETQQSLTENLFKIGAFFERKGKWVSAGELALSGLKKVLKPFEQ
jgi:TolB-like protein